MKRVGCAELDDPRTHTLTTKFKWFTTMIGAELTSAEAPVPQLRQV